MGGSKKGFNKYEIRGDIVVIFLENKKGEKFETLIDLEDLERIKGLGYHWFFERTPKGIKGRYARATVYQGYIDGKPKYKTFKLHRLIMNAKPRIQVDHIDHKTLDNRKENLRMATPSENYKNRNSANSNNTSGYRNVSKIQNKWVVQMQVDGKNKQLKRFPLNQIHEAGAYAAIMRKEIYGEFAGNN